MSSGTTATYARTDVVTRPVHGIAPTQLAVIWRADDHRGVVRDFVTCCCVD